MKKNNKHIFLSLITWLVILIIWYIVTETRMVPPIKLPSPSQVINVFVDIVKNGYNYISLWQHLGISLFRLLSAIILAILTAIPLGLVSGYFPKLKAIFNSVINFIRPLPPLAYYTLLIVWFGIGETSKVTLLYIAAFMPIYISSLSAVSRVNQNLIMSAETLGANNKQTFFKVILPASLPEIFVGIRTAVSIAYTTLVSAEMIAATAGIGWMVLDAYKYLKTEVVFVGIIIMGLTGILLDYILTKIEKKVVFWNGK
ncbi:ABC transporter permease [Helcococcus kunzii]|uniref:ABC transporter permease n=1 Tax=Helcococcus kunzii TaxID=40091 RepID=UPI001BAF6417|nr:ABC transporter permease [Helcococcus kunzii]MCT1795889.1 ABC transporter permease [Helcococcus kunzii]MCT1988560.1 ABC transporter permease [Helcococcus kunzii]QUY65175.1 ABC transporter permease [Helcococcus kunzii]